MVEQAQLLRSEVTRSSERQAFIRAVPQRAAEIIDDESFLQYTRDHILEFQHRIARSDYSKADRNFILRALDLATVAYQDNDDVKLRKRKQTVRYDGKDVNIPYIEHPLSVAAAMIGEPRQIKLQGTGDQDADAIEIVVRQDPYRAEDIAAALLHDVKEDSKLRLGQGGVLRGSKAWTTLLKEYFAGDRPELVDSTITIIDAVTKYEAIPKGLLRVIQQSPTFMATVQLIEMHMSRAKSFDQIENEVGRTLSDLHKMISTCFGIGSDVHFDENSFQNFFGALAIKCHDVEHNLEDSKVREDKLVRAQILASFARIYGLPVASRIAAHLIISNQFDMFWGLGDRERNLKEGRETVKLYGQFEKERHRPIFVVDGEPISVDALQIPILTPDEISAPGPEHSEEFRSVLQYRMTVRNPDTLARIKAHFDESDEFSEPMRIEYEGKRFVGFPVKEQINDAILESGRECYYFNVYSIVGRGKNAKRRLAGIYRFQDANPSAHDVLKLGSKVEARDVPETQIIQKIYDGDPESSMRLFSIVCEENTAL